MENVYKLHGDRTWAFCGAIRGAMSPESIFFHQTAKSGYYRVGDGGVIYRWTGVVAVPLEAAEIDLTYYACPGSYVLSKTDRLMGAGVITSATASGRSDRMFTVRWYFGTGVNGRFVFCDAKCPAHTLEMIREESFNQAALRRHMAISSTSPVGTTGSRSATTTTSAPPRTSASTSSAAATGSTSSNQTSDADDGSPADLQ
jgi:hypothetical protein